MGRRWAHATCDTGEGALFEARPQGRDRGREPASAPAPTGVLEVWTDGACSGNPGPGGWAWAIAGRPAASGGERATTNQRMEIQAALEAVRALEGPLVVVSDSTYVVNCFRDALVAWLAGARLDEQREEAGREPRPVGAAGHRSSATAAT